jgi:hypothetical protein
MFRRLTKQESGHGRLVAIKHGLGLAVSSQRPSELSKIVLSQCSSFVVHRLQNPEDLRYFREIVPGIYGEPLNQLPALVRIREARPLSEAAIPGSTSIGWPKLPRRCRLRKSARGGRGGTSRQMTPKVTKVRQGAACAQRCRVSSRIELPGTVHFR